MVVSITGIIINLALILVIFVLLIFGFVYNSYLNTCETVQSPFCHTIQCPCDTANPDGNIVPCAGYAKQPTGTPGQWHCSQVPGAVFDDNGIPV